MQLNDAARKLLYRKRSATSRCRGARSTFPDEGWHDGDDELVNRGLVQKGPDDPASAHYPDVLASLRAEAFGKGTDRLGECSKPSGQSECKTRTGTGGAEARTERKVRRGQKSQFR